MNGAYELANLNEVLQIEGVYIHMYGKTTTSHDRKLGHFTILADTRVEVIEKMEKVKGYAIDKNYINLSLWQMY